MHPLSATYHDCQSGHHRQWQSYSQTPLSPSLRQSPSSEKISRWTIPSCAQDCAACRRRISARYTQLRDDRSNPQPNKTKISPAPYSSPNIKGYLLGIKISHCIFQILATLLINVTSWGWAVPSFLHWLKLVEILQPNRLHWAAAAYMVSFRCLSGELPLIICWAPTAYLWAAAAFLWAPAAYCLTVIIKLTQPSWSARNLVAYWNTTVPSKGAHCFIVYTVFPRK